MALQQIGERVKQVRREIVKLRQFEMAKVLCLTQASLSAIEKQKVLPSCFFLYSLCTAYNINLNWLLTGKGELQTLAPPD
jgi:DNA-binding XRE family transcriptional regulator